MSRNTKIIIAVILIILVIVICCFTFMKKDKDDTKSNENVIANETAIENIVEENVVENSVVNEIVENKIVEEKEEPIIENVTEVKPQGTVYESKTDTGTTDKKQEAIGLVKEKWGEDSTVTFRCDSVSSKGEYIIAVVSKETATVKNYFKVNLKTKTVEVDY